MASYTSLVLEYALHVHSSSLLYLTTSWVAVT
jgi:hypothetical protein